MEEGGAQSYSTALLPSSAASNAAFDQITRNSSVKSLARRGIKFIAGLIFIAWAALMFYSSLHNVEDLFASTSSALLAFSGPVLLIALLAALYGTLSEDHDNDFYEEYTRRNRSTQCASYSLSTFPVLVNGPFGVVSGAELIGILLFSTAVVWAIIARTMEGIHISSPDVPKSAVILEEQSAKLGTIGILCLAFLFIPVARGSVLLQLINIPYEHAIRYHIWLGHLTMLMFTLHGVCIMVAYTIEGTLLDSLLQWANNENRNISHMPGVIALACGLLMWATSLQPVRRKYFELFYYIHHLYIGFVVLLALHVSDLPFSIALGGVLIFMLDRLLRFCQSRKIVDVISLTRHSCGVIELVISKPTNLRYNAMSFVSINARKLSLLQWHPFSVSSSPMDNKNHLTILIKALGHWTTKLKDQASSIDHCEDDENETLESTQLCQSRIPLKVFLEGPYGHDTPYYLLYKNLVLVAGGIGISPFVAILRDVINRVKDGRSIIPSNVVLIWAIKRSEEMSLLPDLESICPSFSNHLDLKIQVYVTRQPQTTSLEEGDTFKTLDSSVYQNSTSSICPLVGTGDKKWNAIYVSSTIVGFVVILVLLNEFYVNPFDVTVAWYKGFLLVGCMITSVVIVGGLVAVLWHFSTRKEDDNVMNQPRNFRRNKMRNVQDQINLMDTKYGCRPNFKAIFENLEEKLGSISVGVIVCGPSSLESSVAKEIRSRSFKRKKNNAIFHFHSHSFQL